ncbi:MAG: acetate--CoA ligase family protein [Magnetococcales bacterium]|nr:acetate--CoA ligase family protein [Magnetococcales bacterium]
MLDALFAPQSIAVIVTSRSLHRIWNEIMTNLVEGGFGGEVIPITSQVASFLGLKCYPSLQESGKKGGLVIIISPASGAVESVKGALKAEAKAIIIIPSGFQEASEEGALAQREIVSLCLKQNVPLLGPNCLGVINASHKMNAAFATTLPESGGISLISQSAALCASLLDWMAARHLGLAKMVSVGNKADINETDCLRYLGRDPETKLVVCYLENISDGESFIRVAEEVATQKPVIIQKAGNSTMGAKSVYLHTGQVSGKSIAYGAAFRRSGVIHAENYDSLLDYTNAFSQQPLPKGDRVAIITNADGPAIMALDSLESNGLRVARLTDKTYAKLEAMLPKSARIGLTVNLQENATAEHYAIALKNVLNDQETDAVLVILSPLAMTDPAESAEVLTSFINSEKPIFSVFMGGVRITSSYHHLNQSHIPNHQSPERAVTTLGAMWRYAQWLLRPPRIVTHFLVNQRRVERIISRRVRTKRFHITGLRAKEILEAYGFDIPHGKLATRVEEAMEVASRLGFPIAMHLSSPDITSKLSVDSVRRNIMDVEAVRDAFDLMTFRFRQAHPKGRLDGIHIERMPPPGQEVVIGMNRDPHFGPMLMFGLGGISVEVMRDVSFHLVPITAEEAMQMLKSTRAYSQLTKKRGNNQVDIGSIAESLQRVSQLAKEFPTLSEIVINPLVVGGPGSTPFAAEAYFSLTELTELS